MSIKELILYRNIAEDETVVSVVEKKNSYIVTGKLIEFATKFGLNANIWQCYIAYLLITAENAYSLSCEMRGDTGGSISQIAGNDIAVIYNIFNNKPTGLTEELLNYRQTLNKENAIISSLTNRLKEAINVEGFKAKLESFYGANGVGVYALYRAFNVNEGDVLPVQSPDPILLSDLIGYDSAKKSLIDNTEAFIAGKRANNCLLFGSAGTGKSSSVKAILNEYCSKGLRMIELYKHQLRELGAVISVIKDRNYKFIIFMDDLSFEEYEVEYKYLKAVIDGSIEKKPDNVLIYATSNRRHLIKEDFSDRDGLHGSETVQEKTSLSARFGEMIFFDAPGKKEFNEIVKAVAKREGIKMDEEALLLAANSWEMSHSGKSGRTARQLIDYLLSKTN